MKQRVSHRTHNEFLLWGSYFSSYQNKSRVVGHFLFSLPLHSCFVCCWKNEKHHCYSLCKNLPTAQMTSLTSGMKSGKTKTSACRRFPGHEEFLSFLTDKKLSPAIMSQHLDHIICTHFSKSNHLFVRMERNILFHLEEKLKNKSLILFPFKLLLILLQLLNLHCHKKQNRLQKVFF